MTEVQEAASKDEIIRGDCPKCGPNCYADVVRHYSVHWEDEHFWGNNKYRILQCRGCETVFFQKGEIFSEDMDHRIDPETGDWETYIPEKITYWPTVLRRDQPEWAWMLGSIDDRFSLLFKDIYGALNNDLRVPTAIGIRTAFDRATELLDIDPAISFLEKLEQLSDTGKIGKDEKEILDTLTDAGSAAAHRGWRPKPQELDTMVALFESFLYRTFILGEEAKKLRASIPVKEKRQPKAAAQKKQKK